ncbi:MAG: DNA polymerase IV [Candidatus Nanopelagicales bacterium]|nr:DNA polymerase IV [Candidatus Nanopelagicales bacterium]MCF8538824.1 DNA polymerase IV [Candidatus Nanopelagicales bacterium]MCF8550477.1 DNA polymerase IV [Candidatus Nanopelagicales bacterium]
MSRSQVRRPSGKVEFGTNDTGCTILHVDMDAFYASVELRDRPELVGKPVVIAAQGNRGVVLTATYEARALGVHSAMPLSRARRIAPEIIILSPHHDKYATVSRSVMALFESITPLVESISLDEAFLDVSGALRRLSHPVGIAELIRARVFDEQGITCSVGVASTKFVAKLASTRAKPDGLLLVPVDSVIDFLHPLPIGSLWGVGEKTEEQLTRLGMRTVGDIAHTPVATLTRALGATGTALHELSWGRDPRTVTPHEPEKSVSNENTFAYDIDDPEVIRSEISHLSDKVAARLRAAGYRGKTVTLKLRFADFTTITRSKTAGYTDLAHDIYSTTWNLYLALGLQRVRIRLVGVKVDGLVPATDAPEQLLFGEPEHGRRDAELAIDALRSKFGPGAVRPGRTIPGVEQGATTDPGPNSPHSTGE